MWYNDKALQILRSASYFYVTGEFVSQRCLLNSILPSTDFCENTIRFGKHYYI